MPDPLPYVSRGGLKLSAALDHFGVDVASKVCADLGSHVGGFVDCLLSYGAGKVYSVDTCYGVLAWKLRKDARVVIRERTNAMHVELPEPVDLVTIDVGWTRQAKILPAVATILRPHGLVITLIKPQYEAPRDLLDGGVVRAGEVEPVVMATLDEARDAGWQVHGTVESPILGHGGNRESLALLSRD